MLAVRQFTLDGLGVSYQPLPEVRDALNDGRLQQLLPEWRIPGLGIYAVTPRRGPAGQVKVAIEALRRAFATDGDALELTDGLPASSRYRQEKRPRVRVTSPMSVPVALPPLVMPA